VRKSLLHAGIDVQRPFRPQRAPSALQTVHLVEIGKPAVEARPSTQARVRRNADLAVDPRRRRRRAGHAPLIDSSTGRDRQPRTVRPTHLTVRRRGERVLAVRVQRRLRVRAGSGRAPPAQPLDVAAEFKDQSRRGREHAVGAPSELRGVCVRERRAGAIVVRVQCESRRNGSLREFPTAGSARARLKCRPSRSRPAAPRYGSCPADYGPSGRSGWS
jgi:hypothetical protein